MFGQPMIEQQYVESADDGGTPSGIVTHQLN
jgi:hypothetical protein